MEEGAASRGCDDDDDDDFANFSYRFDLKKVVHAGGFFWFEDSHAGLCDLLSALRMHDEWTV